MIPITRGACPASLVDAPRSSDSYNKEDVVQALWEMQFGKCCYCERRLPEKGHLKAVEHFAPKAIFTGRRNEWGNLLLACAQCNGRKSDKFPVILSDNDREDKVLYVTRPRSGTPAIIDPSTVNPEDHIDFDFSTEEWKEHFCGVMAKGGSTLGEETIATIGLFDGFYWRLHWDHYSKIIRVHYSNLLDALHKGNALAISGQRTAFESLMAPQEELAGLARAFARSHRLHEPPVNLKIPTG